VRRISLVVLLAALPLTLASPAASVGKRTFHDPLGDVYCCTRDLTDVTVRNDDAGKITFEIRFDDRFEGNDDDDLYIVLDTDRNPATGDRQLELGVDYMIAADVGPTGADGILLSRWDGTQLREYRVRTLRVSVKGHKILVTFDRHLIGDTDGFDFNVQVWEVAHGNAYSDGAGPWSFPVRIAARRLRPKLEISQHPRAGHRFVARLALRVAGTKRRLASGRVLCWGSVGGRRVEPTFAAFAGRRAVCVWQLPNNSRGKTIRGSVGVAITARVHVTRRFAAVVG
jgi:hypothetical protein